MPKNQRLRYLCSNLKRKHERIEKSRKNLREWEKGGGVKEINFLSLYWEEDRRFFFFLLIIFKK